MEHVLPVEQIAPALAAMVNNCDGVGARPHVRNRQTTQQTETSGGRPIILIVEASKTQWLLLAHKALTLRLGLPVILCTSFSDLIKKEQARAMGIRAYLMKPVSVNELSIAVRKALDENTKTTTLGHVFIIWTTSLSPPLLWRPSSAVLASCCHLFLNITQCFLGDS